MGYLTADDFLAGIVGQEEDVEIAGMGTVRIRPLTAIEAAQLYEKTTNPAELALRAVGMALVEPKLTDDQVLEMFHGTAGRMTPLIQRVMALAGMGAPEESEPLAGGGS